MIIIGRIRSEEKLLSASLQRNGIRLQVNILELRDKYVSPTPTLLKLPTLRTLPTPSNHQYIYFRKVGNCCITPKLPNIFLDLLVY